MVRGSSCSLPQQSRCLRVKIILWPSSGVTSREMENFIFVCPSRVKIGTVWRQHKDDGHTNQQDIHTMVSRWPHSGREEHTKSTRSCNFWKTFCNFFDMPKILWTRPKLLLNPKKPSRRTHDGLRCSPEWPDVFTIISDDANSFIVCPSRAKIGTVWR